MLILSPRSSGQPHKATASPRAVGTQLRTLSAPAPRAAARSRARSETNLTAHSFTNLIFNIFYGSRDCRGRIGIVLAEDAEALCAGSLSRARYPGLAHSPWALCFRPLCAAFTLENELNGKSHRRSEEGVPVRLKATRVDAGCDSRSLTSRPQLMPKPKPTPQPTQTVATAHQLLEPYCGHQLEKQDRRLTNTATREDRRMHSANTESPGSSCRSG